MGRWLAETKTKSKAQRFAMSSLWEGENKTGTFQHHHLCWDLGRDIPSLSLSFLFQMGVHLKIQ